MSEYARSKKKIVLATACMVAALSVAGCASAQTVAGGAAVDAPDAMMGDVATQKIDIFADNVQEGNVAAVASVSVTPEEQAGIDREAAEVLGRLSEYEHIAAYVEATDEFRRMAPFGEPCALANVEGGPVARFVSWSGTLNVEVLDAKIYGSLEEAQENCTLGMVLQGDDAGLYDQLYERKALLVMRVSVENVDAVSDAPSGLFAVDAFSPTWPLVDEQGNQLSSWLFFRRGELATFDGAPDGFDPTSYDRNDFALAPGETRVLTLGWWIDGAADPASIVLRPSLSASEPGPFTLNLGLDEELADDGGDADRGPIA